jgi:outer membrane murein-binding lipoprotein Lpp
MRSKKPYYIVLAVIISATLLQGCQGMDLKG